VIDQSTLGIEKSFEERPGGLRSLVTVSGIFSPQCQLWGLTLEEIRYPDSGILLRHLTNCKIRPLLTSSLRLRIYSPTNHTNHRIASQRCLKWRTTEAQTRLNYCNISARRAAHATATEFHEKTPDETRNQPLFPEIYFRRQYCLPSGSRSSSAEMQK
jgi:hypothetical protein